MLGQHDGAIREVGNPGPKIPATGVSRAFAPAPAPDIDPVMNPNGQPEIEHNPASDPTFREKFYLT